MSATRLPGKPLLKINGLSIISHVFKRAESANIGKVVVATVMTSTLTSDHRTVDGALSAQFMREFKIMIEDPLTMLL